MLRLWLLCEKNFSSSLPRLVLQLCGEEINEKQKKASTDDDNLHFVCASLCREEKRFSGMEGFKSSLKGYLNIFLYLLPSILLLFNETSFTFLCVFVLGGRQNASLHESRCLGSFMMEDWDEDDKKETQMRRERLAFHLRQRFAGKSYRVKRAGRWAVPQPDSDFLIQPE